MSDVTGSRFLRMAGDDDFQNRLNRSAQPTGTQNSSISGNSTVGNSGRQYDYSKMATPSWTEKSNDIKGSGSYDDQVKREKYLEDNNIAQGGNDASSFVAKYSQINRDLQKGNSDGTSVANKYIQNAANTNPMNVTALDRQIRSAPLYHHAKSELEGLKAFGDMYRYGREQLPEWKMPEPMEAVKQPDFKGMYDRSKDDLDELKI